MNFSDKLKSLAREYAAECFPDWQSVVVTMSVRVGESNDHVIDSAIVQKPRADGSVQFPSLDRPATRTDERPRTRHHTRRKGVNRGE